MKHTCNNIYFIFFCLALMTGCKDEEAESPPCDCGTANTIEELREWAFFKEGTYWIYEEETTLSRDTVAVVNSHDFITDQGNVQFDYETYRSSDDYLYWFWFNEGWTSSCGSRECCKCRTLWCNKYRPGDADGQSRMFRFPNFEGNYSYLTAALDTGFLEVVSVLDSWCHSDNCYDDVVISENSLSVLDQSTINDDYYSVKYYFSKSVGIIRKEIADVNEIWNLVDFNIVQ